jgi:hypothetical protein
MFLFNNLFFSTFLIPVCLFSETRMGIHTSYTWRSSLSNGRETFYVWLIAAAGAFENKNRLFIPCLLFEILALFFGLANHHSIQQHI